MTSDDATDRAAAADPRFNVTLEASAGTGKTRVLVTRYIRLVEEGADPRHILAITFTRKAAGEMKSRIISELRDKKSLWREIRERLFEIHITTIDAFCLGLLREFPLEAGLDPDVGLLDEVDIEELAEGAVDEAFVGPFLSKDPNVVFLLSVFGEAAVRRGIRDFLRSRLVKDEVLTRFVRRTAAGDLDLHQALKNAATGLNDALGGTEAVEELLACGPGPSRSQWIALAFALGRAVTPRLASAQDIEQTAAYFLTAEGRPRKRMGALFTKSDFPNRTDYQKHRDLVLARAPGVAEVYRRWSDARDRYAVRELWKLYQRALRRFDDLKESRHGLDFTDVLLRAVGLLRRQGDFSQSRYRLESRYHHLLLDEFQDTNPAQWSLVQELIRSWGEGAGLVQDIILGEQAAGRGRGLLREPSIFIVGDRKQSIYGWRDARVEVMETAARKIARLRPGGGKRLHIRRSFRARGGLLAFLNDVFSQMPKVEEALPWTFRYGEIDHFPVPDERRDEQPVGLAVAPDRFRAAAAVADEIVRLLDEESYRPRDIAILFRSRTHYRAYEEALAERGVPTYVYRGLGFFDSAEVRDVQALVRYLAEPGSDLRAAELARSRFIMLSDTGLALLAQTGSRKDPQGPLVRLLRGSKSADRLPPHLSAEDRAAVTRAAETVPRWIDKVDRLPPADLLQEILDETDYPAWFADPRVARQGWENLKKILERVRRAQNRGYMTLSRLADYLERASSGEESLAVLEAVDAVNLMTIHAAKGLEFDAVFVVNLDQKTRRDTSLPRITEKSTGEEETVEVHALGRPEAEGPDRAVEEEKRLLYVALTRARRDLVLSASASRASGSEGEATLLQLLPDGLRQVINDALTTTEETLIWKPKGEHHRLRIIQPGTQPRKFNPIKETPRFRLALEPLPDRSPSRLSVGAFVQEQTREAFNPWALDPLDLAVGSAVHRMFEHAVPADANLEEVAEALAPETPGRTPSERRAAVAKAADFYRSLHRQPDLTRLMKSGRVYREVPFSLARAGRVIRGAIDALVLLPGEAVVIDYKTGTVRPEHRMQMELYLEAARALYPEHNLQGIIFYPNCDPVRIDPPRAGAGTASQMKLF